MKLESNIPGCLSSIEGSMIQFLASKCSDGCITQIGCLYGRSTEYIINGKSDNINAYLIDIDMLSDMKRFESPSVYLIEANSNDSTTLEKVNEPIEFLFIDGDHSYNAVLLDIELWYQKVLPGGVIMFHDVYGIHGFYPQPDVQRAVFFGTMHKFHELHFDDFIFGPYHRVDTSLIIQRR